MRQAQVVVSTVHKSKGREWNRVRIGDGFTPVDEHAAAARGLHAAEARLAYVAVTRARRLLDTTGLTWAEAQLRRPDRASADHTPEGVALAALPLTGQLQYPRSPMSVFMARHLPHPEQVVGAYHQQVRHLPHPVQPMDERRPDWAALGHTIDYHLRLSLGGDLGAAVDHGIRLIGSLVPLEGAPGLPVRSALAAAGTQLLARVQAHLDGSRPLGEDYVTRLCHVAGNFEAVYRNGVFSRRRNLLAQAEAATTLKDLTAAVPAYVLEDIAEQMQLATQPFAPLRRLPAAQRVCGPVFAGSSDLGGADADFITGGLLIDCKATVRPHQIGTAQVQQHVGEDGGAGAVQARADCLLGRSPRPAHRIPRLGQRACGERLRSGQAVCSDADEGPAGPGRSGESGEKGRSPGGRSATGHRRSEREPRRACPFGRRATAGRRRGRARHNDVDVTQGTGGGPARAKVSVSRGGCRSRAPSLAGPRRDGAPIVMPAGLSVGERRICRSSREAPEPWKRAREAGRQGRGTRGGMVGGDRASGSGGLGAAET